MKIEPNSYEITITYAELYILAMNLRKNLITELREHYIEYQNDWKENEIDRLYLLKEMLYTLNKPEIYHDIETIASNIFIEYNNKNTCKDERTIEIEIPKRFMNCDVTIYNYFIANTNDSSNWDSLKFPLPKPKYKWNIKGYKSKSNIENKIIILIDKH